MWTDFSHCSTILLKLNMPHGRPLVLTLVNLETPTGRSQEQVYTGVCLWLEVQIAAQPSYKGSEAEALPSSTGGTRVTLLMKQKILESNCWWIITRQENSQLHWLGEQGVSFWTSGVNELWPKIYNLVMNVMDLTLVLSPRKLAHSFGLFSVWARGLQGFDFCTLPLFYSALKGGAYRPSVPHATSLPQCTLVRDISSPYYIIVPQDR